MERGSTNETAGSTEADILIYLFKSLQGSWRLERRLNSSNASEPSGRCHGVAHFTSRPPSKVERDSQEHDEGGGEMLYHEEGQFQMQAASAMVHMPYVTFSRKYVWRINSREEGVIRPEISLYFVKPGTEEVDYLFHRLIIHDGVSSQSHGSISIIRAHGSHLCVQDQYETDYTFMFMRHEDGAKFSLEEWQTVHTVKGPKKDQRIETTFSRGDVRLDCLV